MKNKASPFMWKYIANIQQPDSVTGGEERPFTASSNEENSPNFIDIIEE